MRGTRHWIVIGLVALLALASVAAGCGSSGDDTSQQHDQRVAAARAADDLGLITEGTLTVGSDIPYPPFEQGKPPDYTGFDIDLMDAIAEKLGLDAEFGSTRRSRRSSPTSRRQVRHRRLVDDDHRRRARRRSLSPIRTSTPTSR